MALAALGIGVLGILDLAGAPIADPAYPAVVVGTCGVMLLVGAFYGRAGGLIFVGLLASAGPGRRHQSPRRSTAATSRRTPVAGGRRARSASTPTPARSSSTCARSRTSRRSTARASTSQADVGRIEVIVPAGLSVHVDADVDGPGHIELFGDERGGIGIADQVHHYAGRRHP